MIQIRKSKYQIILKYQIKVKIEHESDLHVVVFADQKQVELFDLEKQKLLELLVSNKKLLELLVF